MYLSIHEGKTSDEKPFDKFMGDDGFEAEVMARFDEFLNESFGEQYHIL
jgi:hypothetical protein